MSAYASGKQTRDILIDTTGELTGELGFSNVSIRAVAQNPDKRSFSGNFFPLIMKTL